MTLKKRHWHDRIKSFCAWIVVFITGFILLDQFSRLWLDPHRSFLEQQFKIRDIRKPVPYMMFKGAPFAKAGKHYSPRNELTDHVLNEIGYPGEVPAVPKPSGEYRIIVLGGSSVFMGNPALPRLIQYQYEKQGCRNIKAYNFGVVSSVSSMELARLVFEVPAYEPDLVISYSGFNDIDEPFVADPRPGYSYNFFIYESNPILDSDINEYPLVPLIAYGSNLLRYLFPGYFLKNFIDLPGLQKKSHWGSEEWKNDIAGIYVDNLVKSNKIVHAFGADFMAFFQPSLYFKDEITPAEKKLIDKTRQENSRDLHRRILARVKTEQEKGLYFNDLSGFFAGEKSAVFKDRVHLHQAFRPRVAVEIFNTINTALKDLNPGHNPLQACRP